MGLSRRTGRPAAAARAARSAWISGGTETCNSVALLDEILEPLDRDGAMRGSQLRAELRPAGPHRGESAVRSGGE